MTRSGKLYAPEDLIQKDKGKGILGQGKEEGQVSEQRADQIGLKNTAPSVSYDIVDQLKKVPAKISIMELLQSSATHNKALLDVLSQAYVPMNMEEEKFKDMVGAILIPHSITFSHEEIAPESSNHLEALHITVRHGDYVIPKVLIDNGSTINVIPNSSLKRAHNFRISLGAHQSKPPTAPSFFPTTTKVTCYTLLQ